MLRFSRTRMSAATAKYEMVYPDRFFKYRFTEQVYFHFGFLEEFIDFPVINKTISDFVEFIRKIHNFTAVLTPITYENLLNVSNGGVLETSLDILVVPVDITSFDKVKGFVSGGFIQYYETIILSAAPKLSRSSSLSFLSMDLTSALSICFSAIVISLVLTHKVWYAIITKPRNKLRQAILRFFTVLWDIFSLFFFEPYPGKMEHISESIACAFWVIGVTFIGFFMSCFLKSEFFDEKYFYIETLEDVQYMQKHANVEPLMLKDGLVYRFLSERGKQDEDCHNWVKNDLNDNNFCKFPDLVFMEMYEEILSGQKTLLINKRLLTSFFGFALSMSETKDPYKGFHFSKSLKNDYTVFPVNSSVLTNAVFRENNEKGMLMFFESKPTKYYNFPLYYAMDFVKWERPMKTVSDLNIFVVAGVFYIYLFGIAICIAMFFIELILGWKSYQMPRKRNLLGRLKA